MELQFETVITSNEGGKTFYSHEPDNTFIRYYKEGNRLGNKSAQPPEGNFEGLSFVSEPRRITPQPVKDFGIKSFPRFGSYGFITPMYTPGSLVVIPINRKQERTDVPTVTIVDTGTTIHVEMTGDYECYRIVVRHEYFATEFVTYDNEFDFVPMYTGDCLITVIGHKNEISITSHPFEYEMTLVDRT